MPFPIGVRSFRPTLSVAAHAATNMCGIAWRGSRHRRARYDSALVNRANNRA
ncbi:hypothetical protein BJ970_005722 [Saccharopolyspora phatthalungensis]|uniref:Uncharacterized protein n=1 Tax=Saccharopolyspora phatthalungensis TaxID=664693 RepID=A0A840QJM6_9PSEU|nr:hypothetical protein [Saccharopolyspora phatthalungensis]